MSLAHILPLPHPLLLEQAVCRDQGPRFSLDESVSNSTCLGQPSTWIHTTTPGCTLGARRNHWPAAFLKHAKMARLLLCAGANARAATSSGQTAFQIAAKIGKAEAVIEILAEHEKTIKSLPALPIAEVDLFFKLDRLTDLILCLI
eukprot:m.922032 g.922032  ORF g.922032 m.922032 type:complete len:146 (-) comp93489_c0_seq1:153-590(-)